DRRARPSITNVVAGGWTSTGNNAHLAPNLQDSAHQLEIEALGQDRLICPLFMASPGDANPSSVPVTVYLNGARTLNVAIHFIHFAGSGASSRRAVLVTLSKVRRGINHLTWSFSDGTPVDYTAIAVALQGAKGAEFEWPDSAVFD